MTHKDKNIAVLGTGSIGSCVGADLADAGLDVVLIDQWSAHVEVMKANGLCIQLPNEELKVAPIAWHLAELAEYVPAFDVVFLTAKSYDTAWLTQLIEPYLRETGIMIGLQNGMNDDTISGIVGVERTIGAVVELSAEMFTPGLVQRDTTRTHTWFGLGELDGTITPRLQVIQEILEHIGRVDLTGNIGGAKWTKLVANSMVMGMVGFLGLKTWEAAKLPGMTELAVRAGRECVTVGQALGYKMEPVFGMSAEEFAGATDEVLLNSMETLLGHIGKNATTASIHDHRKGRKSEMSHITGLVVLKGKELGISTPVNAATTEIDRRINEGELEMDVSNLGLLKAMLDSVPN